MSVSVRLAVLLAALMASGAASSAGASEDIAYVTQTLVGSTARYEVSFDGAPAAILNAPIGAADGQCSVHAKVRTAWPAGSSVTLKRRFFLPDGSRNVRVHVGVNDTAYVFVNGQLDDLGVIVDPRCPQVARHHDVEADLFVRPGVNDIEVNAFGGANRFITLTITAEVPVASVKQPALPAR